MQSLDYKFRITMPRIFSFFTKLFSIYLLILTTLKIRIELGDPKCRKVDSRLTFGWQFSVRNFGLHLTTKMIISRFINSEKKCLVEVRKRMATNGEPKNWVQEISRGYQA